MPRKEPKDSDRPHLISRVFGIDSLKCPKCPEGRLRLVAFITEKETIGKILAAMDMPNEVPRAAHARPPPQEQGEFFLEEAV